MHEGRIFAAGSPKDVLTEENIRTVYGVESKIIDDEGRPYIVVRDDQFKDMAPISEDTVCVVGTGTSP